MRTVTATEKYNAIREGAYSKEQFLRDMRMQFPKFITNHNSYSDVVNILKSKGLIFENKEEEVIEESSKNEWRPTIDDADRVDLNTLDRGIDFELIKLGVNPDMGSVPEDMYNIAKKKAVSNLAKHRDYYLHKIAGTKPNKDKKIANLTPIKKDNVKDTKGGFQKVNLKEGTEGPCWDGYEQVGMKKKNGKEVPNCVPVKESESIQEKGMFDRFNKNEEHPTVLGRMKLLGDMCEVYKFAGEIFLISLRQDKLVASTANYGDEVVDKFLDKVSKKGKETFKHISKSKVKSDIVHKDGEVAKQDMELEEEDSSKPEAEVDIRDISSIITKYKTNPEKYDLAIRHLQQACNAIAGAESGDKPMGKSEDEIYEAVRKIVKNKVKALFEESIPKTLNEAKAENLERFINYENDENEELAARIRKGATTLAEYIAKIEKMYLETRDNIEKVYGDIGAIMAPGVAVAFKEDLKPVMAKYFTIDIPKSKKLSPEDEERLGVSNKDAGSFFTSEGKIITNK